MGGGGAAPPGRAGAPLTSVSRCTSSMLGQGSASWASGMLPAGWDCPAGLGTARLGAPRWAPAPRAGPGAAGRAGAGRAGGEPGEGGAAPPARLRGCLGKGEAGGCRGSGGEVAGGLRAGAPGEEGLGAGKFGMCPVGIRDVGGGGEALPGVCKVRGSHCVLVAREEILQGTRTADLLQGTLP